MGCTRFFNSIEELNPSILSLPNKSVIVYTYGAWDILHPGHVKFLIRARELGDFLTQFNKYNKFLTQIKNILI